MNAMFSALSAYLSQLGLSFYVYEIKLHLKEEQEKAPVDEDCQDASKCIDFVVRIKCSDSAMCSQVKSSIRGGKK